METRALNQAVRRNAARFPADFVFQLNRVERDEVITICDHLEKLKFSSSLPFAFTEHGALMAASVLDTPRAVQVSLYVVRAFVSLRQAVSSQASLVRRLDGLEAKYDRQFKVVFDAIREMMNQPAVPRRRRIGFIQND